MTIYKLTKDEINQALADFIAKKYGITGKHKALMDLHLEGDQTRNTIMATVNMRQLEEK